MSKERGETGLSTATFSTVSPQTMSSATAPVSATALTQAIAIQQTAAPAALVIVIPQTMAYVTADVNASEKLKEVTSSINLPLTDKQKADLTVSQNKSIVEIRVWKKHKITYATVTKLTETMAFEDWQVKVSVVFMSSDVLETIYPATFALEDTAWHI